MEKSELVALWGRGAWCEKPKHSHWFSAVNRNLQQLVDIQMAFRGSYFWREIGNKVCLIYYSILKCQIAAKPCIMDHVLIFLHFRQAQIFEQHDVGLPRVAGFFRQESEKEQKQAEAMLAYLTERGAHYCNKDIKVTPPPPSTLDSLSQVSVSTYPTCFPYVYVPNCLIFNFLINVGV